MFPSYVTDLHKIISKRYIRSEQKIINMQINIISVMPYNRRSPSGRMLAPRKQSLDG